MTWWTDERIDPAYATFSENILAYADVLGDHIDDDWGLKMSVGAVTIETPVELDLVSEGEDDMAIGCAPPIYREATTLMPVFHTMRVTLAPYDELRRTVR